jgi:hypothetical protein
MREVPAELIQEIDDLLGLKGRPYRRFADGRWQDTGCYQWTTAENLMEIASSISPELAQAMAEVQRQMAREASYVSKPMKRMRAYFLEHFPDLITEYDAYIVRLQEAEARLLNPSGIEPPTLPEELRVLAERISQQVNSEMSGSDFDLDLYQQRVQELWAEQPEDILAIQKQFQRRITDYEDTVRNASTRKRDRLQVVRSHIQHQPYSSYGNVIVAPTDNQYDILRIEETNAANYGLQTEDLIDALERIDQRFGLDVLNAGFDSVRFKLKEPPSGEEAAQFVKELYTLCPDLEAEQEPDVDSAIELWWD